MDTNVRGALSDRRPLEREVEHWDEESAAGTRHNVRTTGATVTSSASGDPRNGAISGDPPWVALGPARTTFGGTVGVN